MVHNQAVQLLRTSEVTSETTVEPVETIVEPVEGVVEGSSGEATTTEEKLYQNKLIN